MSTGLLNQESATRLPELLGQIDHSLVELESHRQDRAQLESLLTNLELFMQLANEQIPSATELAVELLEVLELVYSGEVMLTSPAFEPMFDAAVLIQEQIECALDSAELKTNSQFERIVGLLQACKHNETPPPPAVAVAPPKSTPQPAAAAPAPQAAVSNDSLVKVTRTTDELLNLMRELEEVTYAGELDVIRDHLKSCMDVAESIKFITNPKQESLPDTSLSSILKELELMIPQWANMRGKEVELKTTGAELTVSPNYLFLLRRVLFKFAEFLIEESLENPSQRNTKPTVGSIFIDALVENDHLLISITDDGRGLRKESIKQKALDNKVGTSQELQDMHELDVWQLIFREGMFSIEDAEVGADFPDLLREIEAEQGLLSIESKAGQFGAFIMAFPMQHVQAKGIVETVVSSLSIPEKFQDNIAVDLNSIKDSAGYLQTMMSSLHHQLEPEQVENLETHMMNIFNNMSILIESLSHFDISSAQEASKTLSEVANVDLFKSVGKMAREMHENLKEFGGMLDMHFSNFDLEQIPDAAHRLEHIIEMTENSANATLDLSESLMVDSGETTADLDMLSELFNQIKETTGVKEAEEGLQLVDMMKNREKDVNEKIVGIMTAQDYQDRTGQVIKKIIVLVRDLENRLIQLIQSFGSSMGLSVGEDNKIEVEATEETLTPQMYGPQHAQGKGMNSQDDVDALLAQFGF